MSEQEYINVRDLSNVMNAKSIVGSITIESQPNIPVAEYHIVMRLLMEWQVKMFAAVKIDE